MKSGGYLHSCNFYDKTVSKFDKQQKVPSDLILLHSVIAINIQQSFNYMFSKKKITLRKKAIISIFLTYALLTSYFLYFSIVNRHHAAEEEKINTSIRTVRLISAAISGKILQ